MTSVDHGGVLAARALHLCGIETVFALPGGHIHPLFAGARHEGLRLVVTRHEENAVLAAAGHSLATGEVSVASVTAGPGLANAIPGMVEANAAGLPVVVIAGRTAIRHRGRGAVQDLDQLRLVEAAVKWRGECLETVRIADFVAEAVHQAGSGAPGVAYLEIPQDVFGADAQVADRLWESGHGDWGRPVPDPEGLSRAIEMLGSAARPVIVAGTGAFLAGAGEALQRFVERSGIPLITTSGARGLVDDDHVACLGSLVHGGAALASADVGLLLGSRFNANLVYGGLPLFSPEQLTIQVDLRPEHQGGGRKPALALSGDVTSTLRLLTEGWDGPVDRWRAWLMDATAAAEASLAAWVAESTGPADGVHPGWLAAEVSAFADGLGPHTLVADGGDSVIWAMAFARAHRPGTSLSIGSAMGTLGVGLPYALGAKVARPDEPVILFTGDGAFGLSALELDTAARHRLPVLVVVANNGGWGDIRHETGDAAFGDGGRFRSTMRYDRLAEAVGGSGFQVARAEELAPALQAGIESVMTGCPTVVDVTVDPEVVSTFMANMAELELM